MSLPSALISARLLIACSLMVSALSAQVELAAKHLEEARGLLAEKRLEQATRVLRQASLCTSRIDAEDRRLELDETIRKLAARFDTRFGKRRTMERTHAQAFAKLARGYIADGLPIVAGIMIADGSAFDPAVMGPVSEAAQAAKDARDPGTPESKADAALSMLMLMCLKVTGAEFEAKLEELKRKDRSFVSYIRQRKKAVKALRTAALGYYRAGWLEVANDMIEKAFRIDHGLVRAALAKIGGALNKRRAKALQTRARPHMEAFLRGHEKHGGKWKLTPRGFAVKAWDKKRALIISKQVLGSTYRIQVDVRHDGMYGVSPVVFAWKGPDEFCTLEFERGAQSRSWIRICAYSKETTKVLAKKRVLKGNPGWRTLTIDARKAQTSVSLGNATCSAELPDAASEGGAFGFMRLPAKASRWEAKKTTSTYIHFRNLVVTTY